MPNKLIATCLIDNTGLWCEDYSYFSSFENSRPALFLDRDGVIIEQVHYLCNPKDVRFIPGAAEVISEANGVGAPVVIVTNQSGIAREYFGWSDFFDIHKYMNKYLAMRCAFLTATYACGYHVDGIDARLAINHNWRKPFDGMPRCAAKDLNLYLDKSWIIGDRASDIACGRNAGMAGGVIVETGYGGCIEEHNKSHLIATEEYEVKSATNIYHGWEQIRDEYIAL